MDDLKRLIRSILISSPLQMDIWKLDKDYNEINGEHIPFRTFGFNSLEHLLRSIPDIVEVQGSGSNAVLKVVVGSKSAHIDKLIAQQRRPETRRRIKGRARRPETRRHTSASHPQPFSPPIHPSYTNPYNNSPMFNPAVVPSHYIQAQRQYPPSYRLPLPIYEPTFFFNSRDLPAPRHYTSPSPKPYIQPRQNHISAPPKSPHNAAATPLPIKSPLLKTPDLPISTNQTPQLPHFNSFEKKSSIIANNLESNTPSTPSKSPVLNGQSSTGAIPKQKTSLSPQTSPKKSPVEDCYYSDQDGYLSDGDNTEETPNLPIEDEYINYNVPFSVQENLKILIFQHEDGIWCGDMPNIYLKMFRKPLDYAEYGYRSLIQMCMGLEKIFHFHRPDNGDFLLFDKTRPMPKNILRNLQYLSSFKTKQDYRFTEVATEPAIIDAEEFVKLTDIYPSEVIRLGEEIPRQFLPNNVKENDYVDVVVGEVYDPSKFWILLKDQSEQLDLLMDEMQTYYTSFDGSLLEIPEHMIKPGLYCAAKYNHEYHRAIIVKKAFEKSKIKVFYADYGTLATINWKGLLFLHKKFKSFPLQAIRARLASIWPPTASSQWSVDASSRFLSLVKLKNLVAHVFRIIRDKQIVEIFLVDTSTEEDIYMNDTLVYEGHALFTNKEQEKKPLHPRRIPKYKYMHFYPTFEDLEWGNALSAAEVVRFYKAGFQEEFLFPGYYIEVLSEETKLNDEQILESRDKLLAEIEKLKNCNDDELKTNTDDVIPSTSLNDSAAPNPDWTELCKEEEEEITNNEKYIGEMNLSSLSEEPSTTSPESAFTPGHQVFATPVVKPPPGFEGVTPNFNYNPNVNVSSGGNAQTLNVGSNNTDALLWHRANMATQVQSSMVLPPPLLMAAQPVNFVPQQVIDPPLFVQNLKPNDLLQQVAFARMLSYQAQQPNVQANVWNQQQYQNMLINQQNSLLFAQQQQQQQNPLMFQQRNPVLFPQQQTLWNPTMFQQPNSFANPPVPGSNCLASTQRQQLQKFVHKHLTNRNIPLLNYLGSMLKCQTDRKEGLLFKIICEIILNQSTTVSFRELEIVVNDLLDLLLDCQIIDLATRQLGVAEEHGNNVATSNISSNNSMNDVLVKLMSQTLISSQTPSNSSQNLNYFKNDKNVEVQTDIELKNNQNESRRRLVIRTALENQPIHVIRFKDNLYVPVNDILQFTITKPPIDMIRKLVVLTDPMKSIIDIRLNEHKELAEELSRYNIFDSTVHVVPVTSIPNMTKILGEKENLFNSYNDFLRTININSDLWLIS